MLRPQSGHQPVGSRFEHYTEIRDKLLTGLQVSETGFLGSDRWVFFSYRLFYAISYQALLRLDRAPIN
jgi:hypothetical protein